jgi:opacity protein-like surface antigen
MSIVGASGRNRKVYFGLIIILAAMFALAPGLQGTACALSQPGTYTAIAAGIGSTIGAAAIAYGIYENWPGRQGEPRYLNGEFYVGGFAGGSLLQPADWKFGDLTTVKKVGLDPGVVGGLKFGYFTHSCPWVGVEMETNYTRHTLYDQQVNISPSVRGASRGDTVTGSWFVWNSSIKLMGRYGFFPDSEVPFGRLQPYVGIGPGFEVIYGKDDAAKNFSLEVEAGLRYMMLKNVSAFVEYKFSQQWQVELQAQEIVVGGVDFRRNATFDVTDHKVVLGVAYHF